MALPARAEGITPTDVYQETVALKQGLQKLGLLDDAAYESLVDEATLRHPRHVMEKARECNLKISKILQSRDLQGDDLPAKAEANEVRPADVYEAIKHLQGQLAKIQPVSVTVTNTASRKVPSDVYNHLKRICYALDAEIVPSDAYRVAQIVLMNIQKIASLRGLTPEAEYVQHEDKVPADVYRETLAFMDDLRYLAFNPDYAIPGGVVLPSEQPEGEVIPQDVIGLMHDAAAETSAMKYILHAETDTEMPQYQEGKKPADVFSIVVYAHAIVRELIEMERREDEVILQ